ncbi:unnamed protein product [Knipowitschia caucasica]
MLLWVSVVFFTVWSWHLVHTQAEDFLWGFEPPLLDGAPVDQCGNILWNMVPNNAVAVATGHTVTVTTENPVTMKTETTVATATQHAITMVTAPSGVSKGTMSRYLTHETTPTDPYEPIRRFLHELLSQSIRTQHSSESKEATANQRRLYSQTSSSSSEESSH